MSRRYFKALFFSFILLMLTPAQSEMTISVTSNLDTLEYDLDNVYLKLEKLESRWQLSPIDSKLFVEAMRAKKLTITLRESENKSEDNSEVLPLPDQIKLPFPVQIQQAEVLELVIVTPSETYTLNNVQFDLAADAKTIQLNYLRAATPFGQAEIHVNMQTVSPFVLTGAVNLRQESINGAMPYDVKAQLFGDLNVLSIESDALLTMQDGQMAIVQNTFGDNENALGNNIAARIHVNSEIGLSGDYPLNLSAKISEFYPERLGNFPAGLLNIDASLAGNLSPQNDQQAGLQLQFSAVDSYLQVNNVKQPLISAGKLTLISSQIRDVDFSTSILDNLITAKGNLGAPDSGLEWRADLPDLRSIAKQFSGEVHANGALFGTFENLAARFDLNAQRLSLNDINIEKLDGKGAFSAGAQGAVEATLNATGLKIAENPVLDSALIVQGTRNAHQIKLTANAQEKIDFLQFETTLEGGLIENQWQGLIQTLSLKSEAPVTLKSPVKLALSSSDITLGSAVLQLNKGRVEIEKLDAGDKGFVSKGKLINLALEDIPPSVFELSPKLQGNPIFSGEWDVNAVDSANANVTFKLDSGDLMLSDMSGATKALGLQEMRLNLQIVNNNVNLSWLLNGQQLGNFDGRVTTTLSKVESGFSLMANAPLTISSQAQLNTIAWLSLPDSLADAYLDGAVNMTLNANGTIEKPNLIGSMTGKNLQFMLPSQGVAFTEGVLQADFEEDELRISQAVFKGGDGYLRTDGTLQMVNNQPKVDLNWSAETFTVISGTDRLLVLNGKGKTTLEEAVFAISGDFKVAKGLLALPADDVPKLGDDVVVLGRTELTDENALKILLNNLRIDLGDDFTLRGRGLDAQLDGAVTLNGLTQYLPHAEGSIRVKKGSYNAYGQVLNITRGTINFSGPIDNPRLNIRAMRNAINDNASLITTNAETVRDNEQITGSNFTQNTNNNAVQNVNAGVEITGNALNPTVKLVSEPNVSDTEKLSWLILGRGTEQAGAGDFAVLSLAAGAVLSQGDSLPLQTKLARATGLDDLSFTGADADTAAVSFGKRLSSQLYLSYQKSVSGLLDVARLTYNITPRWALQAETGTESAVDALYTFSFK